MAFLTNISGMPLFSTVSEALEWGASNSILKGYHTHRWKNRIGYMAGHTHGQAVSPTPQALLQQTFGISGVTGGAGGSGYIAGGAVGGSDPSVSGSRGGGDEGGRGEGGY